MSNDYSIQTFDIEGRLPSLNDYVRMCRGNKYVGNDAKQEVQKMIALAIRKAGLKPVEKPCTIFLDFAEPDNRRDVDNVQFGQKFILDALVREKILPDDNRKWVRATVPVVFTSKHNPHIHVAIHEHGENEPDNYR